MQRLDPAVPPGVNLLRVLHMLKKHKEKFALEPASGYIRTKPGVVDPYWTVCPVAFMQQGCSTSATAYDHNSNSTARSTAWWAMGEMGGKLILAADGCIDGDKESIRIQSLMLKAIGIVPRDTP